MNTGVSWTLADVLDFEYFLATAQADDDPAALAARIAPRAPHAPLPSRREVFRAWVDLQRERQVRGLTPGERLRRGEALLAGLAWLLGVMAGAGLAGAWLARSDAEPVNAPLFWMATVGLQMVLLVLSVAGWLWRRRLGAGLARAASGWQALWQALILRAGGLGRRLPGERREAVLAGLGQLALRREGSGALLTPAAMALTQRLGVGFNLGLLVAMLALHLPLVDLRFGWQSTYPITAPQMHQAVQVVAMPWRWVLPQAQPSADQIAATRYGRGQRVESLPAEAAHAWWPFLALSVACYGLLLRGVLLLSLQMLQRHRLAAWRFDHPEANALWRRLTGPLVHAAETLATTVPRATASGALPFASGVCVALVAQELVQQDRSLRTAVQQRFGWQVQDLHRVTIDDRGAGTALLATLPRSLTALVVVVPADRDPIVAVALYMRAVLQAAQPGVEVLLLVTPPDAQRLALWQRFVQIQHLRVGVEALE